MVSRRVPPGEPFRLHANGFVLATTMERVHICAEMVARLEGKSSLGRLGLSVHSTAGFIDPGFDGQVTLELSNHTRLTILLWPGMPIGQIAFDRLDGTAARTYAGKYQGQRGPQVSRFHQNYDWDRESWTPA
jgi:dCTP deaminase